MEEMISNQTKLDGRIKVLQARIGSLGDNPSNAFLEGLLVEIEVWKENIERELLRRMQKVGKSINSIGEGKTPQEACQSSLEDGRW